MQSLQRVNELNKTVIQSSPKEGVRLALYLQRAGYADAAVAEMERLIAMVPAAVASLTINGQSPTDVAKASFEAEQYAILYDKLRLILQREKRKDEAQEYKQLARQWLARQDSLLPAMHKALFMNRYKQIQEAARTHPYAGWLTVEDPLTPPDCQALAGKVWRIDAESLENVVYEHFARPVKHCRCRLTPMRELGDAVLQGERQS